MDIITAYTLLTLAWSILQSLPLLLWPSLISTLLSSPSASSSSSSSSGHGYGQPDASCADLETYYARSLALSYLAIGLFVFVLSGFLPLAESSSSSSSSPSSSSPSSCYPSSSTSDQKRQQEEGEKNTNIPCPPSSSFPPPPTSPYATAAILISTFHHASNAFYLYSRTVLLATTSSSAGYVLGCAGNSLLACLGLWILLFAGKKPRVSRRTGRDKRTSAFPFGVRKHHKKKEKM